MAENKTVIVCDDDPVCLGIVCAMLESDGFEPVAFTTARDAIAAIESGSVIPSAGILSTELQDAPGYGLCEILQSKHPDKQFPVVLMTTGSLAEAEAETFAHGAKDFVSKPIRKEVLSARVRTHWQLARQNEIIETHRRELEEDAEREAAENSPMQSVALLALVSLCGERDQETGSHIVRIKLYTKILAEWIRKKFPDRLPAEKVLAISRHSPLHDIGKIGIPEHLLLKPGKLTDREFGIVRSHVTVGYRAIETAGKLAGFKARDLDTLKAIIRSHHERWDGKGYPDGLSGEQIPIEARIMALADVYDAMRSKRPYKDPLSHSETKALIAQGSGTQFDPDVVRGFLENQAAFETISEKFQTSDEELRDAMSKIAFFEN